VSVAVTAGNSCDWTATESASWINITGGSSGTGNGTVTFSVSANTGSSRSGTLTIAGKTFTVTQAALVCVYTISPNNADFKEGGGNGTVAVTTLPSCSWTASEDVSWISITSGASGTGNGTVRYSVSPNDGKGSKDRKGTMTIAGHTFTVDQKH
jgi:all-beta uncharacterized protein